ARRLDARPARPAGPDDRRARPRRLDDPPARGRAQRCVQRDVSSPRDQLRFDAGGVRRVERRPRNGAVPGRPGRRGVERPAVLDPVNGHRARLLPARPGRPRGRGGSHVPPSRRDGTRRPRVDGEGWAHGGTRARAAGRVGEDGRVSLDVAAVRARFTALQRDLIFFDAPGGSQVPDEVIDAIATYLRESNANTSGPYGTNRRTTALEV